MKAFKRFVALILAICLFTGCSTTAFNVNKMESFYANQEEVVNSLKAIEEESQPDLNPDFYAVVEEVEEVKEIELVALAVPSAPKDVLIIDDYKGADAKFVVSENITNNKLVRTFKLTIEKGTTIKELLTQGVPSTVVDEHTHSITKGKFKGKTCVWAGDTIEYSRTVSLTI